jgi:hypothetical protein
VIRTPLQDVLHETSSHHYAEWARLLFKHGFVQKDALDAVAVIPPQPPPTGEDASNAVLGFVFLFLSFSRSLSLSFSLSRLKIKTRCDAFEPVELVLAKRD